MTQATFWDKIAPKYFKKQIADEEIYQKKLDATAKYLTRTARVLEVGCGTGGTALKFSPQVAYYLGTDYSQGMIDQANFRLKGIRHHNIQFDVAAITAQRSEAPFDVVMAFSLLHLTPNLPSTLAGLAAQMNDGGYLITKTPCLKGVYFWMPPLIKILQWIGKAPDLYFYTEEDMNAAMRSAGFDVVESQTLKKNDHNRYIVARKKRSE